MYICRYSKDETLKMGDPRLLKYSHLLVENRGKYSLENEAIKRTHDILEDVNCFHTIGLEYQSFFPIKIKTKPCISIAKRKPGLEPPPEPPKIQRVEQELPAESATLTSDWKRKEVVSNKTASLGSGEIQTDSNPEDEELSPIEPEQEEPTSDEDVDSTVDYQSESDDENQSEDDQSESRADEFGGENNEFFEDEIYLSGEDAEIPNELFENIVNSEEIQEMFSEEKSFEQVEKPTIDVEPVQKPKKRSKNTKIKLKRVIESYYRSKGKIIESDPVVTAVTETAQTTKALKADDKDSSSKRNSAKINIKRIIKTEKIKGLVEKISTLDLKAQCDLETLSAKDCLIKLIDQYDTD